MIQYLISECANLGFKPRDIQVEAIQWLESVWESSNKCKVLSSPVGSGKSLIAKTIASYNSSKGLKTAIITPQNILIDQYIKDFNSLNYLKGKVHYSCENCGGSCFDGQIYNKLMHEECDNCPYDISKEKTFEESVTIFNPITYFLLPKLTTSNEVTTIHYDIDTIIIDEVQSLPSMLKEMVTIKLWSHEIQWQKGISSSIPGVIKLLDQYIQRLTRYLQTDNLPIKDKIEITAQINKIHFIVKQLTFSHQYFICEEVIEKYRSVDTACLLIRPKYVPKNIADNFFKIAKHIIFMSGTIFPYMYKELGFEQVDYLDLRSPIPKENRPVYALNSITISAAIKQSTKYKDVLVDLSAQIKYIINQYHPNESGVILLPYNLAADLKLFLTEDYFIHMDKKTKQSVIKEFLEGKKYGVGVLSGAYEGLSLNGHISRFTIIPKVPYPNLMDKVVKVRSIEDPISYKLETMSLIIQASGRSVRGERDYGACYILDTAFPSLYYSVKSKLPKYFTESVIFGKPTINDLKNFNVLRKKFNEVNTSTR